MRLRKIKYLILLILMAFVLPINVLAEELVSLKSDKNILDIGDEVTITAKVTSDHKLYALTATLSYDESVFENIDDNDFTSSNGWSNVVYNKYNNEFGMINKTGEILDNALTIHLKVKKNASVGNTLVTLNNISASDGKNKFEFDDSNVKILVTRDATPDEVVPKNKTMNHSSKVNDVITTFTNRYSIISAILLILILVSIIILVNKYKVKNKKQIEIISTCLCLLLVIILLSLSSLNFNKKDINKDNKIDYDDSKDIINYIIDIKKIDDLNQNVDEKKKNYSKLDLNNDGRVDVIDVAKSVNNANKTDYKVNCEVIIDNYYVLKNESISLQINATVSPSASIKKVVIDNKEYNVQKNGNLYSVVFNAPNKAGVHEFQFSKVILDNNREISIDIKKKLEVLKDKPYVDMLSVDDEENIFSFTFEDIDSALLKDDDNYYKGSVIVTDPEGNEVINEKVKKENHFTYKFKKDITYKAIINAEYDLDTNKLNSITGQKNKDEIIITKEIVVTDNYNFNISNIGITDAIEKGEKPIVTFESTNDKNFDVESITINGKEYPVTKLGENRYQAVMTDVDTSVFGKYYVTINKIGLSNLKVFNSDKDFKVDELTYNVLKNSPHVNEINLVNKKDSNTINASYKVIDSDNTLRSLTAVLVDSTDKIIDTKNIDNPGEDVLLSYKNNVDGRYKVKFLSSYNLGTDKHMYTDKNIGEKEILTQDDIYIKNATVTTIFPTKGQPKYKVTYEVYVGESITSKYKYNEVAAVTVNGLNYDAEKTKTPFVSAISFTVPSDSGILQLEATRVQLRYEDYNNNIHEFFSVKPYVLNLDVLKDKPTIKNLEVQDEDYDNSTTTFKFDVVDDKGGFNGGEIELNGVRKQITRGENIVTFENVEKDITFDLNFYGDYELDTNTLDIDENLNSFKNELIYKVPYGLYNSDKYDSIKLTNIQAISIDEDEYFEKNEDIKLKFNIEGLDEELQLSIDKIVINGKEYSVENIDDNYYAIIKGYSSAGVKEIDIKQIILNNGKKVTLADSTKVNIEVLKDPVKIDDFDYSVNDENINIKFSLDDKENSVFGELSDNIKIKVFDEDNKLIKEFPYNDEITLEIDNDKLRYYVRVYANYDRDTDISNNKNDYEDINILDEVISLDKNYIELKDITDITLFKGEMGNTVSVDKVNVSDLKENKDSYFVKISTNDMPTIYAKIKKVLDDDDELTLILDYEYITKEKEIHDLRIEFGSINNGFAVNEASPESFSELLEKIRKNPSGNFKLTRDYNVLDLEDLEANESLIPSSINFTGTLDGNGHKIYNLDRQLFNKIGENAVIKNLTIENADLSGAVRGILADTATNVTVDNVHIIKSVIKANSTSSGTGIMFGDTRTNVEIKKSSIISSSVTGGKRIGGFIGYAFNKVTISNSYINDGSVSGNQDAIGGFVGEVSNMQSALIENCYAKVKMNGGNGTAKGGFLGYTPNSRVVKLNNSLSLADGDNGKKVHGNGITASNSYELETSKMLSNKDDILINSVSEEDINNDLFKNSLKWNDEIWDINNVSYNNLPKFKAQNFSKFDSDGLTEYDETKETLYNNLRLLMPFYSNEKIVKSALNISDDDILSKQEIMHIIPVDATGNIVTYLTNDNQRKISKLKIVFKNNERKEYDVVYDKTYDIVASYRICNLKIDYTFNHYVIDSNAQIINNLTNYLLSLKYEDNLDKLTQTADSRIYREYYDDVTKNELKEFVLKYLSNSDYTNTTDDEVINDYLEREVKKEQKIEKVLYVYNYFKRFYSVDVDGIMLNDLILFDFQGFNKNLTPYGIALKFLSNDNNLKLNATNDTYNRMFASYTKLDTIPEFLEYLVNTLSDLKVDRWYASKFKGYLTEIKIDGHDEILYTLWDHIKSKDVKPGGSYATWYNYALPIITLPENSAYIISSPTQFIIGAQRTYTADPDNINEQEKLKARVKTYADRMKVYYENAYKILENPKYFNDIHTVQIDKRYTYDSNGNQVFQNQYTTQEPFHKNFNEVVGVWAYNDYNAATANGTSIIWRVEGLMDGDLTKGSEYTYHTWSHETAHNIDARLFLKNNGRRTGAGGEDYADGNLTQDFGDGTINMNISINYGIDANVTSNLTPERINTPDKIKDFYQKMFEVSDFLDYLEALAFLKLDPSEQAKLAVKVVYLDEDGNEVSASNTTRYKVLTEEDFRNMKLTTVDDLWDNQITIKPGVTDYQTVGINRYGGYSLYTRRWYQPHDDNGRPDSYSFKEFAWEMLGYKGYDEGYIEYYSDKHGSDGDLGALRAITGYSSFREYKLERYKQMKENMTKMKYIDATQVIEDYKNALKTDALNNDRDVKQSTNVKRSNYYYVKRITNDFTTDIYADTTTTDVHVNNAESFVKAVKTNPFYTIVLDSNIDFSSYLTGSAIIDNAFSGIIKGDNHKIYNLNIPLFNNLNGAKIYDLNIENVNIDQNEDRLGALAKNSSGSVINRVNLKNITINANKNKEVGTLIGYLKNTRISNVHATEFTVSGTTRIGGLIGFGQGGNNISSSSANGTVTGSSNAVGGLAGEANGDTIMNTYAIGSVKGATDVGGLVGWADNSSIINNFAKVDVNANKDTGGFVGKIVTKANIKNNISFSNNTNGYKFDGRTEKSVFENGYSNNYEIEEYNGKTALSKDVSENIIASKKLEEIKNIEFYTITLGWSQDVWDLSNVESGGLPKLIGNDSNGFIATIANRKQKSTDYDEHFDKANAIIKKEDEYNKSSDQDDIDISE